MSTQQDKAGIRAETLRLRSQIANRAELSRMIMHRVLQIPAVQSAQSVLWYLDVRSEVQTRATLFERLQVPQKAVVPYCHSGRLELFHLCDPDELALGSYGILEPRAELRSVQEKSVNPSDIDVVIVPGVAFDLDGNRLGHGKGYYDRLLEAVPEKTLLVAPAFSKQIVPVVPVESHDRPVHVIVTELDDYLCRSNP